METAEHEFFRLSPGIDMDKLTCKYVNINMNGVPLSVRTYIYNNDLSKKTILMTHGYCMASLYFSRILPALSKHFRIVMIDNLAFGLNSRTENMGNALENADTAEKWLIAWWEKVIFALDSDLPKKFYMSGHSAGGYQCMLYACFHPERIEGIFLQSPAGVEDETRPGFVYD